MTPEQRIEEIDQTLGELTPGWLRLAVELDGRIAILTAQLVNRNDDETRGRIKALQELKELPVTLQQERDGIKAGLADEAPED